MRRITRFGVLQTAKVAGVIYFFMGLVIVMPLWFVWTSIMGSMYGDELGTVIPFSGGFALLAIPVMYGVMGFVGIAIMCSIYNLVSNWVGGIEVEVESDELIMD